MHYFLRYGFYIITEISVRWCFFSPSRTFSSSVPLPPILYLRLSVLCPFLPQSFYSIMFLHSPLSLSSGDWLVCTCVHTSLPLQSSTSQQPSPSRVYLLCLPARLCYSLSNSSGTSERVYANQILDNLALWSPISSEIALIILYKLLFNFIIISQLIYFVLPFTSELFSPIFPVFFPLLSWCCRPGRM